MYYGQFGEDRILAGIFSGKDRGVCVEVGANDGAFGSATLHFEGEGWDCVLVEPVPELCRQLRQTRSGKVFDCAASSQDGEVTFQVATGAPLAHAVSMVGGAESAEVIRKRHGRTTSEITVKTRRLDDILEEASVSTVDFITIDVEGHELEALKGLTLDRWKPRVVILEDNAFWGDRDVGAHMKAHGYVKFNRTGVNDWYAPKDDPLAAGRLGYYPAWVKGQAVTFLVTKVAPPIFPLVQRMPGFRLLRRLVVGAG